MKLLITSFVLVFAHQSFASRSIDFICSEVVPEGKGRVPAPIAYLTVRGGEIGPRVFSSLSVPVAKQGHSPSRKILKARECTKDEGSKPDFTCSFPGYRVHVPLTASDFPENVTAVRLPRSANQKSWNLNCTVRPER